MKTGDKAQVVGKHPHSGATVTLISYGPYGLAFMNAVGWLVRRESGEKFYCDTKNLRKP